MNVLLKLLDEVAREGKFGYYSKCKNIDFIYLCFADDLMVFADGIKKSIEGILRVFEDFDIMSGLKISKEKSVLFMAGNEQKKEESFREFQFATGLFLVRYLGFLLLIKNMIVFDYFLLIEKIRKRISLWANRFFSYAGRLQLINSVIMSVINFWMVVFRFFSGCIKEIERICLSFLWFGIELNGRKVKIVWSDICRAK